jgi:tetracycline repressor-like protein
MGLRERKKRLVQATIEETALRLFQQHGYDQTSIQDIADAVMMSPRTFFRYFSFKEDILFAPTQTLVNDGVRYLWSRPSVTHSVRIWKPPRIGRICTSWLRSAWRPFAWHLRHG